MDKINQEITDKEIGDNSGIDPFLLRIDKIDKLDLAPVLENNREADESPAKEDKKEEEQKAIPTEQTEEAEEPPKKKKAKKKKVKKQ